MYQVLSVGQCFLCVTLFSQVYEINTFLNRWDNWEEEMVNYLPIATQLESGKARLLGSENWLS